MKVQAIVKYFDTELGKVIKPTDKPYEVSEERAKELLGDNKAKIVCVKVVEEEPPKAKGKSTISKSFYDKYLQKRIEDIYYKQ